MKRLNDVFLALGGCLAIIAFLFIGSAVLSFGCGTGFWLFCKMIGHQ